MIGKYTIDECIGQSLNSIYCGYFGSPRQRVIIKKFTKQKYGEMEARILRRINCESPYLLCMIDYITKDEDIYIVYQNIRNVQDLSKIIFSNAKLNDFDILNWMDNICRGVIELHCKNIIHLDLKPENILVSSDRAIVIDYDLSCIDNICSYSYDGTIGYICPERARTFKSDVYSLGVVFYNITSGKWNLFNYNHEEMKSKTLKQQVEWFRFKRLIPYSQTLTQLYIKMLEPDPNERCDMEFVFNTIEDLLNQH